MSGYFEGWYLKHQANGRTLAFIPGRSETGAFVQIISENASYQVNYPLREFQKGRALSVGENIFSENGAILNIHNDEIDIAGHLKYSNLTPIKCDIMGPFRFFPMECRHGVISMRHDISGYVVMNDETLDFSGGAGYIETDSGTSFPSQYAWIHCNGFKENCSIMASIAQIPFCLMRFWGCICVVWLNGIEYRLATYRGARIKRCSPNYIVVQQGNLRLAIEISAKNSHILSAPKDGSMTRTIRESASCPAKFLFTKNGHVLFEGKSEHASFEYAMDTKAK